MKYLHLTILLFLCINANAQKPYSHGYYGEYISVAFNDIEESDILKFNAWVIDDVQQGLNYPVRILPMGLSGLGIDTFYDFGDSLLFHYEDSTYKMYDFSLEQGDSFHIPRYLGYHENYTVIIDSMDQITLDSTVLIRQFVSINGWETTLLQGIGSVEHGLLYWESVGKVSMMRLYGICRNGTLIPENSDSIIRVDTDCSAFEELLSIKTIPELNFELFPNPAHNDVYISCDLGINRIQVMNINGKSVSDIQLENQSTRTTLNIAAIPDGIYTVLITTEGGEQIIQKLVKH